MRQELYPLRPGPLTRRIVIKELSVTDTEICLFFLLVSETQLFGETFFNKTNLQKIAWALNLRCSFCNIPMSQITLKGVSVNFSKHLQVICSLRKRYFDKC